MFTHLTKCKDRNATNIWLTLIIRLMPTKLNKVGVFMYVL